MGGPSRVGVDHVYSPVTDKFTLAWNENRPVAMRNSSNSGRLLAWQGLPGGGLGGLDSRAAGTALFAEPYTMGLRDGSNRPRIGHTSRLRNADRSPSPTCPSRCRGPRACSAPGGCWGSRAAGQRLTASAYGLLTGQLTNPLECELTDCMVLYENWMYPVSGTLSPGEAVTFDGVSPRNLEWHLSRRRVVDSKDVGTPWDQGSRGCAPDSRNDDVLSGGRRGRVHRTDAPLSTLPGPQRTPADGPSDPGWPQCDRGQPAGSGSAQIGTRAAFVSGPFTAWCFPWTDPKGQLFRDRDARPDEEVRRAVRDPLDRTEAGRGRPVRLHRPQRRGQDDHDADPGHAAATHLGRGLRLRLLDLHPPQGDPPPDRLHARLLRRLRRHEGDRVPGVLRRRLPHQGAERRRKVCDEMLELVDLGYKRDAFVTSLPAA